MIRLAIETSGALCSVALIDDGIVVAATHENVGRGHAERLLPMIAALPGGGRADEIVVDCGPGSFTGIRVGIAAARALGVGWKVPVSGFTSLALLAARWFDRHDGDTVTAAIHGGHSEIFLQNFGRQDIRSLTELQSVKVEYAITIAGKNVVGSAGEMLVGLRGYGSVSAMECNARDVMLIDSAILPPRPIYGRRPDAKILP